MTKSRLSLPLKILVWMTLYKYESRDIQKEELNYFAIAGEGARAFSTCEKC